MNDQKEKWYIKECRVISTSISFQRDQLSWISTWISTHWHVCNNPPLPSVGDTRCWPLFQTCSIFILKKEINFLQLKSIFYYFCKKFHIFYRKLYFNISRIEWTTKFAKFLNKFDREIILEKILKRLQVWKGPFDHSSSD